MGRVHVGRQPIFDRSLGVLGYELLFRASESASGAGASGDLATTRVIVNTFAEFGLERLVGQRIAFVNVTRAFVTGALPIPLPPGPLVLELLEDIPAEPEVIEGARRLRCEGFTLALDDFAGEPERLQLLPYCSYVKIDIDAVPADELGPLVARCLDRGLQLVAERIDSQEDLERCRELGFHYFQGYHLLRPSVVSAAAVAPSQLAAFRLLSRLEDAELPLREVEEVLRTDAALAHRLLKAVNAAYSGSVRRIGSIRDALVLLGLLRVRSWLLLLALTDAQEVDEELLGRALTRARACELLTAAVPQAKAEAAFLVGLLSGLHAALGIGMDALLAELPLAPDIRDALLHRAGPLGGILTTVLAYEAGDADAPWTDLEGTDVSRPYLEAVGWSLEVCAGALSPG